MAILLKLNAMQGILSSFRGLPERLAPPGKQAVDSSTILQKRMYTPPSRRTWSKQHHEIFTRRPLTQPFAMHKLHPEKEWWRERKDRPSTFMGFPDVTKTPLRGGSTLIEQMDPVTLSVVVDKCLREGVRDVTIWEALSRRSQQIMGQLTEPSLGYIYRSFALRGWYDGYLVTSLLGRIQQRISNFQCRDCANILTAMSDKRFRHDECLAQLLEHTYLLLRFRNDLTADELAYLVASLRDVRRDVPNFLVSAAGNAVLHHDLNLVDVTSVALTLESMVDLNCGNEALLANLVDALRNRLNECCPKDLVAIARTCAEAHFSDLEFIDRVVQRLHHVLSDLTPSQLCMAAYSAARCDKRVYHMFRDLRGLLSYGVDALSPADTCRAFFGFVRSDRELNFAIATLAPRIANFMDVLEVHSLFLILESASHVSVESAEVEDLASSSLHRLHKSIASLAPNQLAVLSKITASLELEAEDFLCDLFERCGESLGELNFEQLAMVCLGIGSLDDNMISRVLQKIEPLATHSILQVERAAKQSARSLLWMLLCFSKCLKALQESNIVTFAVYRMIALLKNSLDELSFDECAALIRHLRSLGIEDNCLFSEAIDQLARKQFDSTASIEFPTEALCKSQKSRFDSWYKGGTNSSSLLPS